VRRHAIVRLAEFEEANGLAINQRSWKAVKRPDSTAAEHGEAEFLTRLKLVPDTWLGGPPWQKVLGIARNRVGSYPEAIDALTGSERANAGEEDAPLPADLAFLAKALAMNGDAEKARKKLAWLRDAMKKPRWEKDAEAQVFLLEAEAVVEEVSPK